MKDKKIKITKKEFYDNGGFANSKLFRKQRGNSENQWDYYKLAENNSHILNMISSIVEGNHDEADIILSNYMTEMSKTLLEFGNSRESAIQKFRSTNQLADDVFNLVSNNDAYYNHAKKLSEDGRTMMDDWKKFIVSIATKHNLNFNEEELHEVLVALQRDDIIFLDE